MSKLALIEVQCVKEGKCWIWKGSKDDRGRPQMHFNGKTMYVRRVARILVDGCDIPEGMNVACECGKTDCVSPDCSVVATPTQRAQLAAKRGSFNRPDAIRKTVLTVRARSRITDEMVESVRVFDGPAHEAAKLANISTTHAKNIRNGTARKDYINNPFLGLGAR